MKRLHIVHIVYSFGIGGTENGIVNLVNGMDPERYQVSIVSLTNKLDSYSRIKRKGIQCEVVEKRKEGNDWLVIFRLASLLKRMDADVVHMHGWGTYLEGLCAAKLAFVPFVIHGEHGTDQLDNAWRRLAFRAGVLGIDRVFAVCDDVRTRFIREYHVPCTKIRTILNGVDVTYFVRDQHIRKSVRQEMGFRDEDIVLGTIGRLSYEKKYETLLIAIELLARKHQHFVLLFTGDVPERENFHRIAVYLGIEKYVYFLGTRNDRMELLNAMDIFVLSSNIEGLPNTLLEAMSVGLPVVSTNVGGIPEIVSDKLDGFLVNPGDSEGLAHALEGLVQSPDLRMQIGRVARERIVSHFRLEGMVESYEEAYSDLLP